MVSSLILKRREMVVLDMGAGIEHLTRGTARGVDVMLIVTEPTLVSIQTARVVARLAGELGIQQVKFVGNKFRQRRDEELLRSHLPPEDIIGLIPFQTAILDQAAGEDNDGSLTIKGIAELAVTLLQS
jgi:CO dehydrogenase maturation factor